MFIDKNKYLHGQMETIMRNYYNNFYKVFYSIVFLFLDANLIAQNTTKLSDEITSLLKANKTEKINVLIIKKCDGSLKDCNNNIKEKKRLKIQVQHLNDLVKDSTIEFIKIDHPAKDEIILNDYNFKLNHLVAIKNNLNGLDGRNINISIKENLFNEKDLDLQDGIFNSYNPSTILSQHATIMATIIGGRGINYITSEGVANSSKLTSTNYDNLFPDPVDSLNKYNINIQNHSYGTAIENFYGPESYEYDKQLYDDGKIIHVFSSGNLGNTFSQYGTYKDLEGYSNLSGCFKQAKNAIVVGSVNRNMNVNTLSSKGPAFDGRVKPDFVAYSEQGTSESAALISGLAALIQQKFFEKYNSKPSNALVKNLLVNSADDVGNKNVDFSSGYGNINGSRCIEIIDSNYIFSDSIQNLSFNTFNIFIPEGVEKFKMTLNWNDPPSNINTPSSLINDLDLIIKDSLDYTYRPWVLNAYPSLDSLKRIANRGRDSINNIEQITIENPIKGNYKVLVHGRKIATFNQRYFISYLYYKKNTFRWVSPSKNEKIIGGKYNIIEWESTYEDSAGILNVSYNDGKSWEYLSNINLKDRRYEWETPFIFSNATFKITFNKKDFTSEIFSISIPPILKVGYVCDDEIMLHWKPVFSNMKYNIYSIANKKIFKSDSTMDTLIVLNRNKNDLPYYALSYSNINNESLKSYTINAKIQGIDCYIRSFLIGYDSMSKPFLKLELSSTFDLKLIRWERKLLNGMFESLKLDTVDINRTNYSLSDYSINSIKQTYRVTLENNFGKKYHSEEIIDITLPKNKAFVIFSNPFYDYLNVISKELKNYDLVIYDILGRVYSNFKIKNLNELINLSNLQSGLYNLIILSDGITMHSEKVNKLDQ